MDGSAMKLTFSGCCRGGRGGRPRDKAATVPFGMTRSCVVVGGWMVDAANVAAGAVGVEATETTTSVDESVSGGSCTAATARSPCGDERGTL